MSSAGSRSRGETEPAGHPGKPVLMSHALQPPFRALATVDALNASSRAGFVLANGATSAQSCWVRMTEDVCENAAEQGITEQEALQKGMAEKSRKVLRRGSEVYTKV